MTAVEKNKISNFLDLTVDYLASGYHGEKKEYCFKDDDAQPPSLSGEDSHEKIAGEIQQCRKCQLGNSRKNPAPGEGALQPLVMVIGEGPGEEEDNQGRPFVGKAGHQLDKMLAAIELSRNTNCYIANVIKCRPPYNRNPFPDETAACAHFLERQIKLLKPKFILVAGKVAANTLLKTDEQIGKLRGKFIQFSIAGLSIPLIITYHPAAVIRDISLKRPVWEDLKLLRARIEETREK
jgi:DNA polymerase